jgi:WS/DGAT/MGAT family acyltransferase
MQRLTGLDASFLYLETPSSHMHVAGLMILDPSSVEGGITLEDVKAVYGARLHLAPPFRRRLVEVPFGLHHPLWVEDPDFDLDYHIRATALPSPGTPEQLSTLVGRLAALPLDRTRPLWEVWVIEGLEDGNVAVLSKVHHAAIDGASGNELTVALLDLTPEIATHEPDEEWVPDRIPNDGLYRELQPALADGRLKSLRVIGDAEAPNLIAQAVFSGHLAARELGEPAAQGAGFRRQRAQPPG